MVAIGPTLNAQAPIVRFVNNCEVCQRNDGVGVAWSEAGRGVAAAGETPTMGVVVESRGQTPTRPPASLAGEHSTFIERLEQGETPGDQVQGTRRLVYKARIRNTDRQRGKSGGYRVIYYLRTVDRVILLAIYSKTEQADISAAEIRRMIEDYEQLSS